MLLNLRSLPRTRCNICAWAKTRTKAAEAEVSGKVTLIVVTPDVALHLHGKAPSRGLPTMRLVQKKKAIAPITDETPKCSAKTYTALAINIKTMVAVGDRVQ